MPLPFLFQIQVWVSLYRIISRVKRVAGYFFTGSQYKPIPGLGNKRDRERWAGKQTGYLKRELGETCGSVNVIVSNSFNGQRIPNPDMYLVKTRVCQPSNKALAILLDRWLPKGEGAYWIRYGEFALDFVVKKSEEAELVGRRLNRRIYKKGVQGVKSCQKQNAFYFGGDRTQKPLNSIATYYDRPSKVTGLPCFHIEWRAVGSPMLKNLGVTTVEDLMVFDHRKFWAKELRLRTIDFDHLARIVANKHRKRYVGPRDGKKFINNEFDIPQNKIKFQEFKERASKVFKDNGIELKPVYRCVKKISNTKLLPSTQLGGEVFNDIDISECGEDGLD